MNRLPLAITPFGRAIFITSRLRSMAMGDRVSANRLLDYLFRRAAETRRQFPAKLLGRRAPDRKRLADGPGGVAARAGVSTRTQRSESWLKHIKPAADFILRTWTTNRSGSLGREVRLLACHDRSADCGSCLRGRDRERSTAIMQLPKVSRNCR